MFRKIQQAEDLVAGRHAVHGDVEKGAELPHGEEEIRRQQDNQQAAGEGNAVIRMYCVTAMMTPSAAPP